jgi:hypothetical protein
MIGAVVRKAAAARPTDEQGSPERAPPTALVAVNGQAKESLPPPPTDTPTRSPEKSPDERFESDPSLVAPVIASPEEVLRARALREQLKKEYFGRPERPCLPWCVGAD